MIAFEVFGVAVPKGSTKSFVVKGKAGTPRAGQYFAVTTGDNEKARPWQESITAAALAARGGLPPIEEPVALRVRFYLPRPKTAPRRVWAPAKKPDLDKLLRALKDGLTRGGIYRDDSQVIRVVADKAFAGGAEDPAGPAGVPRAFVEITLAALGAGVPVVARPRASQLWLIPQTSAPEADDVFASAR